MFAALGALPRRLHTISAGGLCRRRAVRVMLERGEAIGLLVILAVMLAATVWVAVRRTRRAGWCSPRSRSPSPAGSSPAWTSRTTAGAGSAVAGRPGGAHRAGEATAAAGCASPGVPARARGRGPPAAGPTGPRRSGSEGAAFLGADVGDMGDDAVGAQGEDTARRARSEEDDPRVAAADAPLCLGSTRRAARRGHGRDGSQVARTGQLAGGVGGLRSGRRIAQPEVWSRCWRRSWAASSTALWRHSAAR
ncbi:MAG: hypothetical protein QOE93_1168 [Actinomycetota bacterium]|nr:hypothetical protein [Actinomycetota bacterium]